METYICMQSSQSHLLQIADTYFPAVLIGLSLFIAFCAGDKKRAEAILARVRNSTHEHEFPDRVRCRWNAFDTSLCQFFYPDGLNLKIVQINFIFLATGRTERVRCGRWRNEWNCT